MVAEGFCYAAAMHKLGRGLVILLVLSLSACAFPGYYGQAINGELHLLAARRSIAKIVADPATPTALRRQLELAEQIRSYASTALGLPRNGSYTSYVALDQPYVSWTVFATKPYSLAPITWCFPVAGCVPYRGYFHHPDAENFAATLRQRGDDVYIADVPAYSTLGWFNDPLLSSMLGWSDTTLANYIFHELAHQELYLKGDADFNESYAVTVADVGVHRWLAATGREAELPAYEAGQRHWHMIVLLVDTARGQLADLYASGLPPSQMQTRKQQIFEQLRKSYAAVRPELGQDTGYDSFFNGPLNNASLLTVSTYSKWVPAFRALLMGNNNDLPAFYQAVKGLMRLPAASRQAALENLMLKSGPPRNRSVARSAMVIWATAPGLLANPEAPRADRPTHYAPKFYALR
ncbi:MAG: aminopeptidase [Gammaproteobacteria bacterium]